MFTSFEQAGSFLAAPATGLRASTDPPVQEGPGSGSGPDKPIDSNATAEGREKNRRTDIKLYANPGQ